MSIDSVQSMVADIRSANSEKGSDGALAAFQSEYNQYSAKHTPEQTSAAMQQVGKMLLDVDKDCALAISADWAKSKSGFLVRKGEIDQDHLMYLAAIDPAARDLDNKPYGTSFDKFMAQEMKDQYDKIVPLHSDWMTSNVTLKDLDVALDNNKKNHDAYLKAKPFVENGGALAHTLASVHSKADKDTSYFTASDANRILEADEVSKLAGKPRLLNDQQVKAIQDLVQYAPSTQRFSAEDLAKAAGYKSAAEMQAIIPTGR